MGNQDSLLVDISNNLDDIRKELQIANQLKLIELQDALTTTGIPVELQQIYNQLVQRLSIQEKA